MASEVGLAATTQGITGASSGAMAGLGIEAGLIAAGLMTGPVGWAGLAIGAGVGAALGGGLGALGGSKAKKSKKYAQKAAAIQQERERNATDAQFLQMIRQGRITRSLSLAGSTYSGITTSSLETSALSSIGSQLGYNIEYLANDRRLYELYVSYMRKAGKAAESYQNTMALISGGMNLVSTLGSTAYNMSSKKIDQANKTEWISSLNGSQQTMQSQQSAALPYNPATMQITVEPLEPI